MRLAPPLPPDFLWSPGPGTPGRSESDLQNGREPCILPRGGLAWVRPFPPSLLGVKAEPTPRPGPAQAEPVSPPGEGVCLLGLRDTHWHSGHARRPSVTRPRRQPAQKWWKQSSRHGRSYCAWHSGHTSGCPLAASRTPGPSRGAKIAPDICRDVQRSGNREQQGPGAWSWGAGRRGNAQGGVRKGRSGARAPSLSRTRAVALEGQTAGPATLPTQRPASPLPPTLTPTAGIPLPESSE